MERHREDGRPDPEALLAKVMRDEGHRSRGKLKLFLGFAAGVGKTYEMLSEAVRRKQRGEDVVIGYVETHKRKGTEGQICDLEIIPRKIVEYRGTQMEEMDTDAILRRLPQVVLVDELAHTNVVGSARDKRWKDVQALQDAGIDVLTTMNVQHLESLNNTVKDITGVWVRETVPDSIVREADEIVMVDITPRALINRLERGDIYAPGKIEQALSNFFREGNLNALREMTLREVAHEVDDKVTAYRRDKHINEQWATHDSIMVCFSPEKASMRLIRRGWRIAQRLKGDLIAIYVESATLNEPQQENLRNNLALADRLGVTVVTLKGNVASEIIRYAQENRITEIVIGHSDRTRWQEFVHGSIINRLTAELRSVDILLVAEPEHPDAV